MGKPDVTPTKKVGPPPIPKFSPQWDIENLEEAVTIVRTGFDDAKQEAYWIVEAKRDTNLSTTLFFMDADGVVLYEQWVGVCRQRQEGRTRPDDLAD